MGYSMVGHAAHESALAESTIPQLVGSLGGCGAQYESDQIGSAMRSLSISPTSRDRSDSGHVQHSSK